IHFAVTVLLLVAVLGLAWSAYRYRTALVQAREAERAALLEKKAPEPVAHVVVEVGDQLQFIDENNPNEVKGVVDVAEDGKIPCPELGWVFVAGKTREEVEQELTKALAPYFVESNVRVIVKKAVAKAQEPR